ncbi:MAG: hypothetical protein JWM16_6162 [Verrucomicrobiales bacterium]|nr:hypothetical protein [Verrucomicrobiales bacterium]
MVLAWPPYADLGHMVPRWVSQHYGREFERRIIEAGEVEKARLIQARRPAAPE